MTLFHRIRMSARDRRRGTVLLLALGVLGILAVAAISYVTIVRLDRASATASQRLSNYQVQVDTVIGEIQSLLVADLFDNKIVTGKTNSSLLPDQWPVMFQDGEFTDIPSVDVASMVSRDSFGATGISVSDDAWLAYTEPRWEPNADQTYLWPQITNLRSGYRWDEVQRVWERDDGRFVDLAGWFLVPRDEFADPSVNLLDSSIGVFAGLSADAGTSRGALGEPPVSVFNRQVNGLSDSTFFGFTGPVAPSDERQWTDTDGDFRPDARWTQLESLGNLYGLNWVVATRIIDASALVNINSSIEFGFISGSPELMGDGLTPADIDLKRLLEQSNRPLSQPYSREVRTDRLLTGAFNQHLDEGLGLPDLIDELLPRNLDRYENPITDTTRLTTTTAWANNSNPTTRMQRRAYWDFVGQSPLTSQIESAKGYPHRDMADLHAFWGTNNSSLLSRAEQFFDGTEALGYLPNPMDTPGSEIYGPLRSKEETSAGLRIREFVGTMGDPDLDQSPTGREIRESARRFLTTVNGVGTQSPVPVLVRDGNYRSQYRTEKVRLDTPLDAEALSRAYDSFVWALAPLLTDRPLTRDLQNAGTGAGFNVATSDAHYGGGQYGPARAFYGTAPDPGGTFALVTAASMAANLADAIDADTPTGIYEPTLLRLVPNYDENSSLATPENGLFSTQTAGRAVNLRLRHGSIATANVPALDGDMSGTIDPFLVVGLERHPYIAEAFIAVALSSAEQFDASSSFGVEVGGPGFEDALGFVFTVELFNPWPTVVSTEGMRIVIPETTEILDDPNTADTTEFSVTLDPVLILPNGRARFTWRTPTYDLLGWDVIRDEIELQSTFFSENVSDYVDPLDATRRVPFWNLMRNPQSRPVMLMRQRILIDRLSPPDTSVTSAFPPPVSETLAADATFNFSSSSDSIRAFGNSYFGALGYDATTPDSRISSNSIAGRLLVVSSMARPEARPILDTGSGTVESGFRGVIERPEKNVVTTRRYGHAWLHPYDSMIDPAGLPNLTPARIVSDDLDISMLWNMGQLPRPIDTTTSNYGIDVAPFQLFVPNGPLLAASEILMLSSVATTYREVESTNVGDPLYLNDLLRWRTHGEKLGISLNYDYSNTVLSDSNAGNNVHLGVLDPSRFILTPSGASDPGDLVAITGLPSSMAIPLALRAPDCFEASPVTTALKQGVININTAPREVLQLLPLVDPVQTIPPNAGSGVQGELLYGDPAILGRDSILEEYRERVSSLNDVLPTDLSAASLPRGLRSGLTANTAGFVTPAETAILGRWQDTGNQTQANSGKPELLQTRTFLEAGSDGATTPAGNDYSPLAILERAEELAVVSNLDPVNDAEERLALYRAISNITSARSDVFIAWIVLRGYDPQVIEQIPVPNGATENQVLAIMDNPDNKFRPAYESRWLVVFDRSQTDGGTRISRPTDRPRILMKVELPPIKP